MSGRHRTPRRSWGRLVGSLLAVAVVGAAATGAWIYRDDLLELVGLRERSEASPGPTVTGSPTRSPEPGPSPSPTPPPKRRLVIHGTGDVNLDPSYIPNLAANGYGYAWSGLNGLFKKDDLTVINLECAVSDLGSPVPKEFNFRCDTDALPAARKAGVDVANLGNNHAGDYGPEATVDSRKNLNAAGIHPVGVGKNARQAAKPAIIEVKGWKIAVLGFGGVVPEPGWIAGPDSPGMADGDSIPFMVNAVRRADRMADLVVVSIHWGVELDTQPQQEDVERAHAMIDAGADMIFGHHSHRLNPMDHYEGRPVFWGLGNFVWPNFSAEGSTTAVAEVVVRPNGSMKGRLLPAYIEAAGHPVLQG